MAKKKLEKINLVFFFNSKIWLEIGNTSFYEADENDYLGLKPIVPIHFNMVLGSVINDLVICTPQTQCF